MRKIYKYPFEINDKITIPLPRQWHKVMHAGLDPNGQACLWVMIHEEDWDDTKDVDFHIYGTGHDIRLPVGNYINTFMQGQFIWHVFNC